MKKTSDIAHTAADLQYCRILNSILKHGFWYEDPNRRGVRRKQIPFDTLTIPAGLFPATGLRQVSPKVAFAEFSAFFNGVSTLHALEKMGCKFWRKDAYRFYKKGNPTYNKTYEEFCEELPDVHMGKIYPHQMYNFGGTESSGGINQVQSTLDEIRRNPYGTKRTVTMWNPHDAYLSALTPCHWAFEVLTYENKGIPTLDILWHQHSTDAFLGLPYNMMYYSYVLHYFAGYLGFAPGLVRGVLTNAHLYDNQIEGAEEVLRREENIPNFCSTTPHPEFRWIKPVQTSLDFRVFLNENKSEIINYKSLPAIRGIEMLTYSE